MCPSGTQIKKWRYPGRTQSLEIIQNPEGPRLGVPQHLIQLDRPVLDEPRAYWRTIIGAAPGESPTGRIDQELKRGIEREFAKRSEYQLVDSPSQADIVFLAEGLYADQYSGFIGVQPGRYRPSSLPILALVMAVAVPAGAFAANPADGEALLDAGTWQGAEAWKANPPAIDAQPASTPASLERLIAQFTDPDAPKSGFPALCAARVLAPSVDDTGMPRDKTRPAGGETVAPAPVGGPLRSSFPDNVIRASVSLVTVPTLVIDAGGHHIPELSAGEFHVFENGVEQKIDRVIPEISPFHVVLMLDTSGSTILKHSEIQEAALAFVDALRPEDRVMVVSFDSYIYLDSAFTKDRAALRRAILQTDTGAGTRLYDALNLVLSQCLSRVEGRKAIVLFTDGIDSQSWLARLNNSQNEVEGSDALVYAVQYDTMGAGSASKFLKALCENSGGKLFGASSASNLAQAFAGIAGELQHQYTICYYPANQSADSALRQLRVTVDRPGAKIRARTGYRIAARRPGRN